MDASPPRSANVSELVFTVKVSEEPYLSLPAPLARALRLCDGDEIQVSQPTLGRLIRVRKPSEPPRPLSALAGIIKSSLPEGSVDMSKYMTKYGYEELCRDEDEEDTEGR